MSTTNDQESVIESMEPHQFNASDHRILRRTEADMTDLGLQRKYQRAREVWDKHQPGVQLPAAFLLGLAIEYPKSPEVDQEDTPVQGSGIFSGI